MILPDLFSCAKNKVAIKLSISNKLNGEWDVIQIFDRMSETKTLDKTTWTRFTNIPIGKIYSVMLTWILHQSKVGLNDTMIQESEFSLK